MERIHGYKIDDLARLGPTGWDLRTALKRGVRAWMERALQHGFFHGDVHAGNLMLDTDGNIAFLDFGHVGAHDDETPQLIRTGHTALLLDNHIQAYHHTNHDRTTLLPP